MGYMPICPVRSNNQDFAQKHQISITQVPLWEISSISSVKKLFKKYKDACAVISCLSSRTGIKDDVWEVVAKFTKTLKRQNHQNSLLVARPEKVTYFFMQVLID